MLFNYALLGRIRRAPADLIGGPSILRLRAFLDGYRCVRSDRVSETIWFPVLDHLREKYGVRQSAHGYPEVLLLVSSGDAAAFALFFEELDEYCARYGSMVSNAASWPCLPFHGRPGGEHRLTFSESLRAIEARPGLYLGCASVTRLHAFLCGELTALRDDDRDIGEMALLQSFESWLNAKEGFTARCRWDRILLFRAAGRADAAFDEFVRLFRCYREETTPR